jgi:hypothetical protein
MLWRTIFILILSSSFNAFSNGGNWVLKKNQDSIIVYTRNKKDSELKEFKALTSIKANRKTISSFLLDIDDYQNWYPGIEKSKILSYPAKSTCQFYYSIKVPWPGKDRDVVMEMQITKDKRETLITYKTITGIMDPIDGYLRMTNGQGSWKLTSKGTHTSVLFHFYGDLGGNLPQWIVNLTLIQNPFNTLKRLRSKSEAANSRG